jgi:hypothetical protein
VERCLEYHVLSVAAQDNTIASCVDNIGSAVGMSVFVKTGFRVRTIAVVLIGLAIAAIAGVSARGVCAADSVGIDSGEQLTNNATAIRSKNRPFVNPIIANTYFLRSLIITLSTIVNITDSKIELAIGK